MLAQALIHKPENKTKSIKPMQNRRDNTQHVAVVASINSAVRGTLNSIARIMIVLVSIHLLLMATIAARVVLMIAMTSTISLNAPHTPIRPLTIGLTTARMLSTSTKRMLSLPSLKNQRRKRTRSRKILKTLIKAKKLPQPRHLQLPTSMMTLTRITSTRTT